MSIDQAVLLTMAVAAVAGSAMVLVHLVGAFLYDAHEVKHQRNLRLHPYARVHSMRPLVTVVVTTHNSAEQITDTLNSILHSNYRKLEVLVIDRASEDMTQQIVKGYIDMHPKQSIRLVARKQLARGVESLPQTIKRCGKGEFILTIPAGSCLDKPAIKRAVQRFVLEEGLDILNPNTQVDTHVSVAGLLEQYNSLLMHRSDKFLSMGGLMVATKDTAMYRRSTYVRGGQRHARVRYAHDVVVVSPALASYRKFFGRSYRKYVELLRGVSAQRPLMWCLGYVFCSAILSMAGPFLAGYFLYIALYLHEPTLLLLSIAGLSTFLVVAIGEEGRLNSRQKATYVLGIPMMYGLFYLLSLVRITAVLSAPFSFRLAPRSFDSR